MQHEKANIPRSNDYCFTYAYERGGITRNLILRIHTGRKMKTFLIFMAGSIMLAATTEGVTPLIAGGLIAWAYYRCGHDEGFKAGKRNILTGK